ncbi:DUF1489 family protein [Gluconobacter morbifer]|uniref:Lysophospholipase n=1 Tax=Gluconobacter morbifer G707 TaxID=1088869 RepID=G6XFM9_9PROT|nr:DUF1489 domain-containing protein [Gluconobacter morbifer]EHH68987.1 hypothetical protein GMO_02940 [Gluconobacter morbifer G707]
MLHIIKLAVGCPSLEALRERMRHQRLNGHAAVPTRTMPRRADEVLDGGSLYRVMDGMVLCRQPIIGLEACTRADGTTGTLIVVSDEIIPVQPRPMKAFQGWRYLEAKDAPPDLGSGLTADGIADLPAHLRRELAELALI